jgi:hypothetical protein
MTRPVALQIARGSTTKSMVMRPSDFTAVLALKKQPPWEMSSSRPRMGSSEPT